MKKLFAMAAALVVAVPAWSQWLELPAVPRGGETYTLTMTIDGELQRNYTFLWNEEHMTADWVAYPLCEGNMGSGKRTNTFGLCPLLPESRQPLLARGYREGSGGWYSRGHQIPSADRLYRGANVQTFYGVNMTPQNDKFNGGLWNTLEGEVRNWARKCDTLYVVSGCLYDGWDGGYVLDNAGKHVAIPTGYYKALLALKGKKYYATAFIFENRDYGSGVLTPDMYISVSDLEDRTGLTFFPALKSIVGRTEYKKIKSSNPRTTLFWWW